MNERIYTGTEVMRIVGRAKKRYRNLPFYGPFFTCDQGMSTMRFYLRHIPLRVIPEDDYFTIRQWFEWGEQEDWDVIDEVDKIRYLKDLYKQGVKVPPVVLRRDLTIIDGKHRVSALRSLGRKYVDAFIQL